MNRTFKFFNKTLSNSAVSENELFSFSQSHNYSVAFLIALYCSLLNSAYSVLNLKAHNQIFKSIKDVQTMIQLETKELENNQGTTTKFFPAA